MALLRPRTLIGNARDPIRAARILEQVAAEQPGNAQTAKAREAFLDLTSSARLQLIEAVDVCDGGAHIQEFSARLEAAVGMHAPEPNLVPEFASRLFAWWMEQVVQMLTGTKPDVHGRELWAFVTELRDDQARRRLSVDADLMTSSPEESEAAGLRRRAFVQQLALVTDEDQLLNLAIIDFWRARTQRVRWENHGDVTPGAMQTYSRRLQDEWQHAHALMCARLESDADDTSRRTAGLALYEELPQKSTARIRSDFHEPVITRGSLHALSDRREIGWHPDYVELLDGT